MQCTAAQLTSKSTTDMGKLFLVIATAMFEGGLIITMVSDPLAVMWVHWLFLAVTFWLLVVNSVDILDKLDW